MNLAPKAASAAQTKENDRAIFPLARHAACFMVGLSGCVAATSKGFTDASHVASPATSVPSRLGPLPAGFVDLQEVLPGLRIDLRYLSSNNFTGRRVDGYCRNRGIATLAAAQALQRVQARAKAVGLELLLYDAYRPQRAVDAFVAWAADAAETSMRNQYYPRVAKGRLFPEGYIAARSGHSRGSTVDLTLVSSAEGTPLDMGSSFDLFDPLSHTDADNVTARARRNRNFLRELMHAEGFLNLPQEWWHFTLQNEPFPDTYFDFIVD